MLKTLRVLAVFAFTVFAMGLPAGAATIHTVTFDENLPTGTSAVSFQTGSSATSLKDFSSITPPFIYPGHSFTNWNTAPNGSGTNFANGASYSFTSDLTLYAQWAQPFHTVTFMENRSSVDSVTAVETKNVTSPLTHFSSLSPAFSRSGYAFTAWNTKTDGTGTTYLDGAKYSFASDLVLYAQWVKVIATVAPMSLVAVIHPQNEASDLSHAVRVIVTKHIRQVTVVTVGDTAAKSAFGSQIVAALTARLGAVTISLRHIGPMGHRSFSEVFAN